MSDEFLRASAQHDANDLSSVVQAGGHWCICAWAWASAVQRDPARFEGIGLECERTNLKLREVYQSFIQAGADLTSPSGAAYKAKEALDAVNKLCPQPALPGTANTSLVGAVTSTSLVTSVAASAASADVVAKAVHSRDAIHSRDAVHSQDAGRGRRRGGHLVAAGAFAALLITGALVAMLMTRHRRLPSGARGGDEIAPLKSTAKVEKAAATPASDLKLGCYDSCEEGPYDADQRLAFEVELTPRTSHVV